MASQMNFLKAWLSVGKLLVLLLPLQWLLVVVDMVLTDRTDLFLHQLVMASRILTT